jgi:hypothetical protein
MINFATIYIIYISFVKKIYKITAQNLFLLNSIILIIFKMDRFKEQERS